MRAAAPSLVFLAGLCLTCEPVAAGQVVPALVDRDLSVAAGATLVNAAGEIAEQVEMRYVPSRLFEERGGSRRAANIAYRVARLLFFDRPQEEWLRVANHEVFGHGGRVRELFGGFVQYHIDAPRPYGPGGGVTYFELTPEFTVHELQAVSVGGMEVNAVAAADIADRAFRASRLSARTALRYLGFQLDSFRYIQRTGDEPEPAGHDVSDFLQTYNATAEFAGTELITPRTLRRESYIGLANPMLASALFSVGRYALTGNPDGPVFTLPVGSMRVMPWLAYRLAPYGTEWSASADIGWARGAAQVSVTVGRAPGETPWGVGATMFGLALRDWRIDVELDGWRQPPLALGPLPDLGSALIGLPLEWGGRIRSRAENPLVGVWWSRSAATLIVEAELKSRGFIPGEPLDEGLVLRAGLGIPLWNR
ncbi:MAG TPA: hypothetical protein VFV95_21130 [Vicinamibacterales bacterium]|nr:hypothetical protein [Vicinamibacterales bacterium]